MEKVVRDAAEQLLPEFGVTKCTGDHDIGAKVAGLRLKSLGDLRTQDRSSTVAIVRTRWSSGTTASRSNE